MNDEELSKTLNKMIEETMGTTSWREVALRRMAMLGMKFEDCLELRVATDPVDGDVFALARRAVNVFFSAFFLYPTSIAVHSTIAWLFEANETVIKAKHLMEPVRSMLGVGFELTPIRVEIDDSLDIRTVAVRFSVNTEDYKDDIRALIMKSFQAYKERNRE